MEVPLQWKLSVSGANDVKSTMDNLRAAFDRGQISTEDFNDSIIKLGRESNKYNSIGRSQHQIFLAMHPNINKLTRGMSTLASVSRTLLTITNALNLAWLRGGQASAIELDLVRQMAEIQRQLLTETDPEVIEDLNQRYNVLQATLKEFKASEFEQEISGIVTTVGAIGLAIGGVTKLVSEFGPKIATAMPAIISALAPLGAFIAPLIILALVIGALIAVFEKMNGIDGPFSATLEAMSGVLGPFTKAFIKFFTIDIPKSLGQAGLFLANFFTKDLPMWASMAFEFLISGFSGMWDFILTMSQEFINTIIGGIEYLINSVIRGINGIISAWNAAASIIGGPTVELIKEISLDRATFANKEEDVKPTQDGGVGVGTGIINNITVMGSIHAEDELRKLASQGLQSDLRRRNFTGV